MTSAMASLLSRIAAEHRLLGGEVLGRLPVELGGRSPRPVLTPPGRPPIVQYRHVRPLPRLGRAPGGTRPSNTRSSRAHRQPRRHRTGRRRGTRSSRPCRRHARSPSGRAPTGPGDALGTTPGSVHRAHPCGWARRWGQPVGNPCSRTVVAGGGPVGVVDNKWMKESSARRPPRVDRVFTRSRSVASRAGAGARRAGERRCGRAEPEVRGGRVRARAEAVRTHVGPGPPVRSGPEVGSRDEAELDPSAGVSRPGRPGGGPPRRRGAGAR